MKRPARGKADRAVNGDCERINQPTLSWEIHPNFGQAVSGKPSS